MKSKLKYGFTLIELLVVIAIMVVLLSVAIPSYYNQREQLRLNDMTQSIVADMRSTVSRAAAQESGQQWGMHFDNTIPGDNFYSVWYGDTYTATDTVSKVSFVGTTLHFTNPASGTSTNVVFTKPFGLPQAPATIVLNTSNASRTINIDANGTITE